MGKSDAELEGYFETARRNAIQLKCETDRVKASLYNYLVERVVGLMIPAILGLAFARGWIRLDYSEEINGSFTAMISRRFSALCKLF
jgi:hypothetical protein